jgi:CRISPR/Cas system-associated exonuclease Cas4 (RecB family)
LKCTAKPALQEWLIRTAVEAITTAPDIAGESLDAKITRVLETERQQDEEAQKARDLGIEIHDGMEKLLKGEQIDAELRPWIEPAYSFIRNEYPVTVSVEEIVVGDGYAGKIDFVGLSTSTVIVDYKSCKKLPDKKSWPEHRLQLAAYAKASEKRSLFQVHTANCYISTVDCGKFTFHVNPDWERDYEEGFKPLFKYWQWANQYVTQSVA